MAKDKVIILPMAQGLPLTPEDENKLLAQELKVKNAVLDITQKKTFEVMRCVKCPILKECPHTKEKLKALFDKAKQVAEAIYQEEIELDETKFGELKASQLRDQVIDRYVEDHSYEVLKNERCIYERKELMTNLQKFVDSNYDVSDPRIYIILNELMNNILNSGRLSKAFTSMGLMYRKETPDGVIWLPNPSIKFQQEISAFIIEAIEALDRIVKSDEEKMIAKDFSEHIIKALRLSPRQRVILEPGYDRPITVEGTTVDRADKRSDRKD